MQFEQLCSVLASATVLVGVTAMTSGSSAVPRSLKLLLDLINEVTYCGVPVDHDFGSGVPLLYGQAKVYVYGGMEFLPNTKVQDRQGSLILKSPKGFRILSRNVEDLNLDGCLIQLQYSVDNSSVGVVTRPSSLWLTSCDKVAYTNGTAVSSPEQVLPLLSNALHRLASDYLTFRGSQKNVNLPALRNVFGTLMYRSIMGPSFC